MEPRHEENEDRSGARVARAARAAGGALVLAVLAACGKSEAGWARELADPDPLVRGLAAIALCELAPARGGDELPVLLETVHSPDRLLRAPAQRALARIARADVARILARIREDERLVGEARKSMLRALSSAGVRAVGPVITALGDPGRSNPRELGSVLCGLGEPAIAPLVERMRTGSEGERALAASLLGGFGMRARPVLSDLLATIDTAPPRVACAAIDAVWRVDLAAGASLPHLVRARASAAREVADAAARSIARIRLMQVAQAAPLEPVTNARRASTVRELLSLGEAAWPVLISSASGADSPAARTAEECVHAIGRSIEIRLLARGPEETGSGARITALHEPGPDARGLRLLELARAGRRAREKIESLLSAARDPHPGVRACAAWAGACVAIDTARGALAERRR